MMPRPLRLVTVSVILALLTVGCSSTDEGAATAPSENEGSTSVVMEFEEIVYSAGAFVRADVIAVRGPFWNSADGRQWSVNDYPDSYASPFMYREVDLKVIEFYRNDLDLGNEITIVARGAGEQRNEASPGGDFVPGDEMVLALVDSYFMMREGPVDRIYALGGPSGVFEIDGGIARSQRPGTELAVQDLPSLVTDSRLVAQPQWDDTRFPPNAMERLEEIERIVADILEENERIENDPNNICNFVGDREKAEEWLKVNPDWAEDTTVEDMLDPEYILVMCDRVVESTPEEG